jgi:hypothetical protein
MQLTQQKEDFTPEQMQLFKDLLYNINEAYTRTFIPLTLINREAVITHLREAKTKIEQLQKVL